MSSAVECSQLLLLLSNQQCRLCHPKSALQLCDPSLLVQMAESEVPVYTTNEHFQGPDAHNAEQARAEMVTFQNIFST